MPSDLSPSPEQEPIQVRDRAGTGLPFSKGIMATSILATGLPTARAHRIAADIERRLRRRAVTDIAADELTQLAAEAIRTATDEAAAERYLAWRRLKRAGRPVVVCLGGAPGVGKSTVATRLALRLGINRVVTTDAIREVLRTVVPPAVLPELHVSTYESVEPRGDADGPDDVAQTFLRQARAVSAATAAVAKRLAAEGRSTIIEGVHVVPGAIQAQLDTDAPGAGIGVIELLLTLADEGLHRGHLTRRQRAEPARDGRRHLRHFAVIRRLQEELRLLADRAGVAEFDIAGSGDLTQRIVDQLVARTDVAREILARAP